MKVHYKKEYFIIKKLCIKFNILIIEIEISMLYVKFLFENLSISSGLEEVVTIDQTQ